MAIDPNKQLPGGPETINEAFFDALVRHQIGLLRLNGSIRKRVDAILAATEQDISDKIRSRLLLHQGFGTPADVKKLQLLLASIKKTRLKAWKEIDEIWVKELVDLAKAEPALTSGLLKTVSPVILDTLLPSVATLKSMALNSPFQGKTLKEWSKSVAIADLARIEQLIKIGMIQGENSAAIASRVIGLGGLRSRRDAAGITRTAVIAISNKARREFFEMNADLFDGELYVATLDARTTMICKSLDGQTFPVGVGPIPPLHFNCRSLRVGLINGQAIGERPMRSFTQKAMVKEFAKNNALGNISRRVDLPFGTKQAFDKFARGRMRQLTGQVPAKVGYGAWLKTQTNSFQNDTLGVTKAKLFRDGGLDLTKFVNRRGDELNLSELAKMHRSAFTAAGIDPEDFL